MLSIIVYSQFTYFLDYLQSKKWCENDYYVVILQHFWTILVQKCCRITIFDYCNSNDINKLLDNGYIEIVEGEIDSSQLQIDEYLYTYVKEFDIFMCLNLEKYEEFVKVQAIYDKCKKCSNVDYLIPYNFKEDWICNSCILDIKN